MDILTDAALKNSGKVLNTSTNTTYTVPEVIIVADEPLKTKYNSLDEAAVGALAAIIDKSIKELLEYAGWVFKNPNDSNFYFTQPRKGKADDSYAPKSDIPVSDNLLLTSTYGTYHTHGGRAKGVVVQSDEDFSPDDKGKSTFGKYYSYLGTPQRKIKKYTPIDLLPADQQSQYTTGLVETIGSL